jgi:hypothetical protein
MQGSNALEPDKRIHFIDKRGYFSISDRYDHESTSAFESRVGNSIAHNSRTAGYEQQRLINGGMRCSSRGYFGLSPVGSDISSLSLEFRTPSRDPQSRVNGGAPWLVGSHDWGDLTDRIFTNSIRQLRYQIIRSSDRHRNIMHDASESYNSADWFTTLLSSRGSLSSKPLISAQH